MAIFNSYVGSPEGKHPHEWSSEGENPDVSWVEQQGSRFDMFDA